MRRELRLADCTSTVALMLRQRRTGAGNEGRPSHPASNNDADWQQETIVNKPPELDHKGYRRSRKGRVAGNKLTAIFAANQPIYWGNRYES